MKKFLKTIFSSSINSLVFALIFAGTLGVVTHAQGGDEPLLAKLFNVIQVQDSNRGIEVVNPGFVADESGAAIQVGLSDDSDDAAGSIIAFADGKQTAGNLNLNNRLTVTGDPSKQMQGTGTITLTNLPAVGGIANVTGVATNFTTELAAGYSVFGIVDNQPTHLGNISSIENDEALKITTVASAVAYTGGDFNYSTNSVAEFKNSAGETVMSVAETGVSGLNCTITDCVERDCRKVRDLPGDRYDCAPGKIGNGFWDFDNERYCCCKPVITCN